MKLLELLVELLMAVDELHDIDFASGLVDEDPASML